MCSSIMKHQDVSHVDFGQHPVDSELIAVFTQRAHHIIFVVAGLVFLA